MAASARRVGHKDDELVAAVTEADVLGAAQLLEPAAGVAEQLAADQMAVRVVDVLEAVEVEKGQADGVPWTAMRLSSRSSTS